MKKQYDKYVTKSAFSLIIGILFLFISFGTEEDMFAKKISILISFMFIGMAIYCMAKERKHGE